VSPILKKAVEIKPKLEAWGFFALGLAILTLLLGFGLFLRPQGSASRPAGKPSPPAVRPGLQSLGRGHDLVHQGRYREARLEFQKATHEDPDNAVAWANLGGANAVLGQTGEARAAYERALDLGPDNWLVHYNLSALLARDGDRKSAVRHLRTALRLVRAQEPTRQKMVADLSRDPILRKLMNDPQIRDLVKP
jgi:tetratricopeptide (TPR) repeat protein